MITFFLIATALLSSQVEAHSNIFGYAKRPYLESSISARCSPQYYQDTKDEFGPIKNFHLLEYLSDQPGYVKNRTLCHAWTCRGADFADQLPQNLYTFSPGQQLTFTWQWVAPHIGFANMSVIDLQSNTILATLKTWGYPTPASGNFATLPADQKEFTVTIPSNLPAKCATHGNCAIQWFHSGSGPDSDKGVVFSEQS